MKMEARAVSPFDYGYDRKPFPISFERWSEDVPVHAVHEMPEILCRFLMGQPHERGGAAVSGLQSLLHRQCDGMRGFPFLVVRKLTEFRLDT